MDNNLYDVPVQICRTCTKEIIDTSFCYLDCTPSVNTQLTIRHTLCNCIPELDLSIVPNTVMCGKCVDNLLSVYEFKKNCLKAEIQINKYIQQVQHNDDLNLVEVVRFHQLGTKNLNTEVEMEDFEILKDLKNEDFVCEASASNEVSECTESFPQLDIKNLDIEVKMENLEVIEDLVCKTSTLNEASECTESTEPKYLLELQKVEMEDVLFNTLDDYNINDNLSAAKEKLNAHNSSAISQNCLPQVFECQSYSKNLNKTNAYYQCYRCGHKAKSKLKLILHLKHHTRKNLYDEIISKRFSRYKNLICYYRCSCSYLTKYKCLFDFHIRIHLLKKNYTKHIFKLTNVRTKAFRTTIKVNRKNIKVNKRKRVTNCKIPCKSKKSKQHLSHRNSLKPNMKARIVKNLFKCSICEYQCSQKSTLKRHILIHTGEKPFSCSLCGCQCSQKSSLKKHMLIHTGGKPFSCSVCKYQCSQKGHLNQHMRIHTGEKPFSCSICDNQFSKNSSLKRHVLIHTGEKPFFCSVCEYQCNNRSNLKKHILIHAGEKPFSCSVCEYQCSKKSILEKHVRIHTGEKPFSCSVSKYQFNKKSSLKRYVLLVHTGEKPFSCSVCEYQFNKKSSLKRHMLIHTGEKPFSCSVCEYQCSNRSNLKRHILIHTGEKPFSCSICEYQCSKKSILEKHVRIHAGEKPFSCSVCEYQCSQNSDLRKHIMQIHML